MIHRKSNAFESLMRKLTYDHLKDWIIADRHQGLWQNKCVRSQSCSDSTSQNNRTLRHCIDNLCTSECWPDSETNRLFASSLRAIQPPDENPMRLSVCTNCSGAAVPHSPAGVSSPNQSRSPHRFP